MPRHNAEIRVCLLHFFIKLAARTMEVQDCSDVAKSEIRDRPSLWARRRCLVRMRAFEMGTTARRAPAVS
jgi:hypothetical protein